MVKILILAFFWVEHWLKPNNNWIYNFSNSNSISVTLSWPRSLSYRKQFIDLLNKSVDWFLYDRDLRNERLNQKFTATSLIYKLNTAIFFQITKQMMRKNNTKKLKSIYWNVLPFCLVTFFPFFEQLRTNCNENFLTDAAGLEMHRCIGFILGPVSQFTGCTTFFYRWIPN